MSCTIDKIQVQNFRGIRHVDLPVKGCNLIVVGENGAGKSSLVDALEYFFTGRVEQLEGRSDVNKSQSIPNLVGGPTEVKVALRGVAPETGIPLPFPNRQKAIPRSLAPLLDLAARRAFVLRRSQLLRFINARDAERYNQISQLIGLARLDRMDAAWRKERNAARGRVDRLRREHSNILNRLGQLLGTPIQTEGELMGALNALFAGLDLPPIAGREELARGQAALKGRTRFGTEPVGTELLGALRQQIDEICSAIAEVRFQDATLTQSMQAFWEQSQLLEDASLEPLLSEGHRYLEQAPGTSSCPLCEEPIRDRAKLLKRLAARLSDLHALTRLRSRCSELQRALDGNLLRLGDALAALKRGLEAQELTTHLATLQAAQDETRQWRGSLRDWEPLLHGAGRDHRAASIEVLLSILPDLQQSIDRRVEALAPTDAEQAALDALVTLAHVDEQWQMLKARAHGLEKAGYVCRQIERVYDELIAARKRGLERLRLQLEEDLYRLYEQMHPGEGYEAVTIPVQQAQRSSIALRARFHDQDEAHPLSFYSEGHLDSLGLCIFLAFIKRFNQDLKLIVLDDVLTTVDAGHRLRVARMLAREFPDFQFVITTHDQVWARELAGTVPNAKLVQLRRWTLGQGVDYERNVLSDWAYYEQQARAGRSPDTIAGAGRNLEMFLFQMRRNLGLAVPAKPDGAYTIGDLYDPFWNWVKKHRPQRPDRSDFAQDLRRLRQELDQVWRLRNWAGAHFNEWAESVSADEALSFLDAIQRLAEAFACPVCQNLVIYKRDARALICPSCRPCPPPRTVCEYKPGWHAAALKLLNAPNPGTRQHAPRMAQSVCRAFFRDMRRRLNLPVLATADDDYDLPQLYVPFFEWAAAHPRAGVADWPRTLARRKRALDAYWQGDRWVEVPEAEVGALVDAVRGLTALFECPTCGQLLRYDGEQEAYVCADCSGEEGLPSRVPAYWYVRD